MMREMLALQTGTQQIHNMETEQQNTLQQPNQQQEQQELEIKAAARQDNTGPSLQGEQPSADGDSDAGGPSGAAGAG